jgi:DNA-binding transcriptional ArsR family regulator
MMLGNNNREEELRKLRDEIEGLKESLRRISGAQDASEEPLPKETVEIHEKVPEEPEETLEEAPEVKPDESSEKEEPWEDEEEEKYRRYHRRDYEFQYDFGDRLGDYISSFVGDVMDGVAAEIEHSLFIHPRGRMVVKRSSRRSASVDPKKAASVMSALGNEYRLKILDALSSGGLYASDLQETLKEISPSTLSSHLDVLEEAGLILQERRRGRYLITIPGRLAIKMSYQIARRTDDSLQ